MTLWQALMAEQDAYGALFAALNKGVLPEDSKLPLLRLVAEYRTAVERRVLIEVRDSVLERIPD